ncbi:CxC2 domain-containing protein [Favolaschia claudopus]|uniref:CxC2 domain-containing protein n=1 Tax=Favolaschia claudopus TaxID=2862362 RepID=A0AAW0DXL7_9AGAR
MSSSQARASASHKRKVALPQLVVSHTATQETFCSLDDRRQRTRMGTVAYTARPSDEDSTRWHQEDLATSRAREDPDFTYQLGDSSLAAEPDFAAPDGIFVTVAEPTRTTGVSRPLHAWYPLRDEYVAEQLRREGRGSHKVYGRCAGLPRYGETGRAACEGSPEYRCMNAECFGEAMYCKACILAVHARLPTHFIEYWTDSHFQRTTLKALGLRMQLSHPPGVVCPYKSAAPNDFILYDLSGIHEVNVDYCGCRTDDGTEEGGEPLPRRTQLLRACWWPATVHEPRTCATFAVLRLFQVLNCLGKLSAYDFLRGLEKCTRHDGLEKPADRRKPFMHVVRQWRKVKRMKRFGRGHEEAGVRGTKQGELALRCRACPQEGWNLPENWENTPPLLRFLYCLFLSQDANFRLSNRAVSSEVLDPIWGDGLGFFCKREGEDGYKAHIARNLNEQEESNCSGFQAMFMANTRKVKGLRTTGVGGVTCARHNMWQGNGIGDLQVGERYCNMDFLLLSVLLWFHVLCIVVSYDIACQYSLNFWERMIQFPRKFWLTVPPRDVRWKVPNFHLPAHKKKCHVPFSFHFTAASGMTHGEGVEQNWSFSNGAAASTKLMGPGARQATLEDIFGFHNYDRQLAMHRLLPKRLAVSIKEGSMHKTAFDAFTRGLEESGAEEVAAWKKRVIEWEAQPHPDSEESPFDVVEEVTKLRDIQLQVATEEFLCTEAGIEVEREHTPGSFVTLGLELEEVQRKLEIDVRALKEPSTAQRLNFTKRRTTLLRRLHKFRQVQAVYMPSLRSLLSDAQQSVYDGNGEQVPEATRLFMPSELASREVRGRACATGLAAIEARMRHGEASDALEAVRHGLRARTMTNRYKLRNWTGQGAMTRGQAILCQINIKIHAAKLRYRYARAALLVLRGHGEWEEELKVLDDDDVRALNERALTAEEKAQNEHWAELGGAFVEGGVERAAGVAAGEGSHTLSWIWYRAGRALDENDGKLHEALRVEWCKAYSRAKRYSEDVRLLREEMRRTIVFGRTEAERWEERAAAADLPGSDAEVVEGRRGYALERAALERRTCAVLEKQWAGILLKAETFLDGTAALDAEAVVLIEVDAGDEQDPEEEEARLEGDAE